MPPQESIKALLIAIGEDPAKAVQTINHYIPDYLLFFARPKADAAISDSIQPKIQRMPKRWDCVVAPDEDSLEECHKALSGQLAELLPVWQVQPGELVMDYSQATHAMGMAMWMAGSAYCTRVVFTQSPPSDPADSSKTFREFNPWDLMVTDESRKASRAFDTGRYPEARQRFASLRDRVSGGQKPIYKALSDLSEGYELWDAFQYQKAMEKIKAAHRALEMASIWGGPAGLKALMASVGRNVSFLERILMARQAPDRSVFLDLVESARRHAEGLRRFEDATARIMRALEVLAQIELQKRHGINPREVRADQLPASLRDSYAAAFKSRLDGRIKLSLYQCLDLLKELGDPLGERFHTQWDKFRLGLEAQGRSLLGHGFEPMKPERFRELFDAVLRISEVKPDDLPRHPQMKL